ncbi:sugar phosphate isomerase/epimerase family protein [Labrys neptuniae]
MALQYPLSFQLYSGRNFPPLEGQLRIIAEAGFSNVEPYGAFYEDVAGAASLFKEFGLTAKSGHFGLDSLEADPDGNFRIAEALGIETIVAPYLAPDARPTNKEGWQALGDRLASLAQRARQAGYGFGWHNHDFEFIALPDGSHPIEHLLVDGVKWEADIAWIVRANADPKPWIARYGAIMPLVHVKDIAPAGEKVNEDGWADVGTGVVDWATIWPLCVAAGAQIMVAEHDNPSDLGRFATVSAQAMRELAKA